MTAALTLVAAYGGAHLARLMRLPGGLMVGAMLATAAATLALDGSPLPGFVAQSLFVSVGILLGLLVNRRSVQALRPVLVPAMFCGAGLIVAGLGTAVLLRALGLAPVGDVLATSPGALSVLSAVAADLGLDAPTVALFHLTRLLSILVTIPVLLRLLPKPDAAQKVADPGEAKASAEHDDAVAVGVVAPASRTSMMLSWGAVIGGAVAGGGLAALIGLGGALIFGATLGTAGVAVSLRRPLGAPGWFRSAVQVGVGWMIGSLVTPDSVAAMRTAILPALLSAVIAIASGIGLTHLLRARGIHLAGDVLATSPGALESLSVIAIERDAGALQVAVFHTLRILLVLISLPLLLTLVPALR